MAIRTASVERLRRQLSAEELDPYLADFVQAHRPGSPCRDRASRFLRRLADRIR